MIHWWRVIAGGVLSEVGVIVVLLTSIAIYKIRASGMAREETQALGERLGYYIAPPAGLVTTGIAALWVVRGLESGALLNGVLVGIVSVIVTAPFFFQAKPEHRRMYGVAFGLRIVGAYLAAAFGSSL